MSENLYSTEEPTEPIPQSKLILPAAPEETYRPPQTYTQKRPIRPEQLIRPSAAPLPKNPVARLTFLWRSDPAFKVLIIAVATIILSGIVGVALATSFVANQTAPQSSASQAASAAKPTTATSAAPTSVPTAVPTTVPAATPIPTQASNANVPTTVQPTATPTTATVNMTGPLTLQITSVPGQVQNDTTVAVTVQASQPGISVKLTGIYTAAPGFFTTGSHTTDANGTVTISWHVKVQDFGFGGNTIVARITAVAQTQTQVVSSQTVTVQINPKG